MDIKCFIARSDLGPDRFAKYYGKNEERWKFTNIWKVHTLGKIILTKFATFFVISPHLLCIFYNALRNNEKVGRMMVNVLSIFICMRCSHFLAVLSKLVLSEKIGLDNDLGKNMLDWLKEHYGLVEK